MRNISGLGLLRVIYHILFIQADPHEVNLCTTTQFLPKASCTASGISPSTLLTKTIANENYNTLKDLNITGHSPVNTIYA
jgi:hypothetical protein